MEFEYDSGLFSELGDLVGHDPAFYEDSGFSANPPNGGDAVKDHTSFLFQRNTSHQQNSQMMSSEVVSDDIDVLLKKGSLLLDDLLASQGLDISSFPIDLSDVDELIALQDESSKPTYTSIDSPAEQVNTDLFSALTNPEAYYEPISPVSTLPSEPSSPVDISSFYQESDESTQLVAPPTTVSVASELDEFLSTILDNEDNSYCHSESPLSSSDSYTDISSLESVCSPSDSLPAAGGKVKSSGGTQEKRKKKSFTPYSKLPSGRKEKKKQQNKEAAIRYRQKKKSETQTLQQEEDELLNRNSQLKQQVLNLEREIMCMKDLLSDVFNVHSY